MRVYHMSGAGNDFAVIDARGLNLELEALAVRLCATTGADGFMAVDDSQIADFKLHFYNSNGLRGEMCGNGSRCICKFAYDMGIAGPEMTVETDAGLVCGWRLEADRYRVRLNLPSVLDLTRKADCAYVELGDPGIPHAITQVADLTWEQAEQLRPRGRQLRFDPAFPKGANVSFYRELSAGHVRVLTYERGVEDYTLACGTGCASIALVLWAQGRLPEGILKAENRGGDLTVSISSEAGQLTQVLLEGPAQLLNTFEI